MEEIDSCGKKGVQREQKCAGPNRGRGGGRGREEGWKARQQESSSHVTWSSSTLVPGRQRRRRREMGLIAAVDDHATQGARGLGCSSAGADVGSRRSVLPCDACATVRGAGMSHGRAGRAKREKMAGHPGQDDKFCCAEPKRVTMSLQEQIVRG
jgi:hypothetical protein